MSIPKTLTKKQLLEILEDVPETALITFALEPEDVVKAQTALPAGMSLMQFGLPGDRAVSEEGIEFLLWAA